MPVTLSTGAAAALRGQVTSLAALQCEQERVKTGRKAFRKRYGAKRTLRSCVRRARSRGD